MTSTVSPATKPPDVPFAGETQSAYSRKAWRVLIASFLVFTVLITSVGIGALTYRDHATSARTGRIDPIIAGSQVLVQQPQQIGFKVLTSDTIGEGYTVQTPPDTRARIVLFDGTAVELSGGTTVKFDRLRSSQYLDRRATIVLDQMAGRAIIDTSTATSFTRANVAVNTPSGSVEARQPGTRFRVLMLPSQDGQTQTMSVSVLEGAAVTASGAGQQVTVTNGQQTTVTTGLVPTAPTLKQRDIVANGTFQFDANDIGKPTTRWREIPSADGDGMGLTPGRAELAPDTVIRGQRVTSLHFIRTGGNVDNDQVGLEQVFPFGELDEFDQVTLTADVKMVSHSLSAGGDIGSEYPLIILLRYEDSRGQPQPDKGWAFYTQNDAGNRTNNGTLIGQQITANTWTPFTLDLKTLRPAPYKLVGMQLYASGHDFDAYVANVSIVAK